jgi:hypothetical protein
MPDYVIDDATNLDSRLRGNDEILDFKKFFFGMT